MARNPFMNVVMARPKRARNTRRRYDLALNTQGVEMRLPALPRMRPGWRLLSFALIALMAVLLYQFWEFPAYRVEAAKISGLKRISKGEVNKTLKVSGEPIFAIDELAIERELQEAFPEFSEVTVAVDFPQTVLITVTERVPVLIWQQDGHSELIDEGGLAFPLREGAYEAGLPVVEAEDSPPPVPASAIQVPSPVLQLDDDQEELEDGEQLQQAAESFPILSPEMVEAILSLAKQAPVDATIRYNKQNGLHWRDPGEWEVHFGDDQDIPMKLVVYKAIYDHLDREDTRPSVISVKYVHAPFYRLEP